MQIGDSSMVEQASRSCEVASSNLAHLLLHFKLQSTSSIFFVVLYNISWWSARSFPNAMFPALPVVRSLPDPRVQSSYPSAG